MLPLPLSLPVSSLNPSFYKAKYDGQVAIPDPKSNLKGYELTTKSGSSHGLEKTIIQEGYSHT
jgi:hypothetical protein